MSGMLASCSANIKCISIQTGVYRSNLASLTVVGKAKGRGAVISWYRLPDDCVGSFDGGLAIADVFQEVGTEPS